MREAPADVPAGTQAAAADSRESGPQALPDLNYYAAADVDVYPRAQAPIVPAYPQAARDARVSGAVTLRVSIDETGRVEDASVEDAEPAGVFDRAAQEAVTAASFSPAQKDGRRVRSRMLIRVEFDPGAR
ncbi:MAG TPA: energy transducer TonB [Burkholderiales bacterium]|nr:energy transducer TonB [Burkholderiales bacterium]